MQRRYVFTKWFKYINKPDITRMKRVTIKILPKSFLFITIKHLI